MKKGLILVLILSLILMAGGCAGPFKNDRDLINGVIDKFVSAFKNHNDSNSLNQFLSCVTDPVAWSTGSITHADWTDIWADIPITDFQANNRSITVSGTSATCTCTFHEVIPGNVIDEDAIIGLTKDSGRWLINSVAPNSRLASKMIPFKF